MGVAEGVSFRAGVDGVSASVMGTWQQVRIASDNGTVIAVEPGIDALATLERSVPANRLDNVRLRGLCMDDRKAVATFWLNHAKPHDFSLLQLEGGARRMSALTITLDELFAWERLDRLDYLKIDAVGFEEAVLRGAQRVINKYRPIVAQGCRLVAIRRLL